MSAQDRPQKPGAPRGGAPKGGTSNSGGSKGAAPKGGGAKGGAPKAGGSKGAAAKNGAKGGGRKGAPRGASSRGGSGAPRTDARPQGRARFADQQPRKKSAEVPVDVHDPDGVRLQKVLAQAGVGSRRASEDLIAAGRVSVDGHTVRELGIRVDPIKAVIHVDGLRVQTDASLVYLAFNKPVGVVSTMTDPEGRPNLGDYVADREQRLFHVGRLDVETEGLLLLTNDGELAHRLTHPKYGVKKTYLAEVSGQIPRDLGKRLRSGVELEDGPVVIDSFRVVDMRPGKALLEVVLHEGRNHVVRRVLEAEGHPVEQLVRTDFGPIRLGDLPPGRMRNLGKPEVANLMAAVDL